MTEIRVRGTATEEVPPDFAVLHVAATARADTATQAQERAGATAASIRAAAGSSAGVRSLRLSRVSVHEQMEWDESARAHVARGWQAQLAGACEVEADSVGVVAGALVEAGAELGYLSWRLEADNAAHRRVRTAAVADARRAAEDFASAVGGSLGELLTLADPGLLGGPPEAPGQVRMAMAAEATAAPVQIDEELVTVSASVEASYRLQP